MPIYHVFLRLAVERLQCAPRAKALTNTNKGGAVTKTWVDMSCTSLFMLGRGKHMVLEVRISCIFWRLSKKAQNLKNMHFLETNACFEVEKCVSKTAC